MNSTLTNPYFWDCECEENYIILKSESLYCKYCDSYEEDQPDSRQNEVYNLILKRMET